MRMQAVHEVSRGMSLNKALRYCGMSKRAWYYVKKPRDVAIDANVTDRVRSIAFRRPTYGTRRMAAQVARETGVPTNRKKIQRIYRKIGWNESRRGKKDIIRASRRERFKPAAPNQLWETDITYIHCGVDGWCYSDTPKFVPRKLHQAENFVDHLILWHSMDETEREELKEAYRKEKDPRVVARMLAVHMVYVRKAGIDETAAHLMRSARWVHNWLHRYDEGGLEGLRDLPRSGRPRRIPRETIEQIINKVVQPK